MKTGLVFILLITMTSLGVAQQGYTWKENGKTRSLYVKPDAVSKSVSAKKTSPTFTDNPDGTGVERTLPGGIIVTFSSAQTQISVAAVAKVIGSSAVRRMPYGEGKVWLIETSAGVSVFNQCDQISTLEGVQEARPNWGIKVVPK